MTADLERRLRVLEDEAEIHRLAARFSDAVNERDLWAFGRLWADEDAVWSIGPPLTSRAEGRETIVGLLESLYKRERYFMQMTHTGVVTLDGGRATARFVVREHGCGDGTHYENLAVYNDELVRQAEGWRFAKRSYAYRFLSQKPVDEEAFKVTGNHPGEISQ